MTTINFTKVLSVATSLVGIASSLLSDWVSEQKMNEKIEEKVNEAFAKQNDKDKRGF